MMKFTVLLVFTLLLCFTIQAKDKTSSEETLRALDASWERAQLELDLEHLQGLLAEGFIWVHNHANIYDDKTAVLARVKKQLQQNNNNTRSRVNKDVEVLQLGDTAVVYGYTIVDRGPVPTTYHFMRTYTKVKGGYYLLSNHTMAIPNES